ncbi:hypothetical protein [Actinomadura chibensis]|uniref:Uncharacterized protein n=1 Tax=Actinomadura chibensis TaxID=392828 RepID=A0A5D0NZ67_9ACTN|nr:hypothetical protein [Actinomadura chibensis]TYB49311.1 hypothetical protein FXF69_09490 [Actinomadura chibensis]
MKRLWDALMRLEDRMLFDSEGRPRGRRLPSTRAALALAFLYLAIGATLIIGRIMWWTEPTTVPGAFIILVALINLTRRAIVLRRESRPRPLDPA